MILVYININIYNFLTLIKSHISNYITFFEAQQEIKGGKEGPREGETAEVVSDENNLSVYQSMCVIAHRKRHFEKPKMKRKDRKIGKQNQSPPLLPLAVKLGCGP